MKTRPAKCIEVVDIAAAGPPRRGASRSLLLSISAFCAFGAASNALLLPVDVHASAFAPITSITHTNMAMSASANSVDTSRTRFIVPDAHVRAPFLNVAEYRDANLANAGPSAADASASSLPPPPTADDLAETDEVALTPAIRSLATTLNNNPVQIYNWVRDHVVFTPTYGSIQGADATLQTLRGNDFDTASLLIALMRAAKIPARYVYGTIEVPIALAQNWVGGVASADAAMSLFAQGGIPSQAVLTGGSISAIQLEHVWVEAFVDFNPSRGAVNRTATTWAPLDASYKQYRYTPGMAVRTDVAVDTTALAAQIKQGATITADSVLALNVSTLGDSYTDFATRVAAYITTHKAAATVGDVLGTQTTTVEGFPILASTLAYKTVAFGARYSSVPDALRWKVQYGLYATEFDRSQSNAIVSVMHSLPTLVGKRLTLSFAGNSADDDSKLATLLNNSPLPTSIPGSQVHTTAKLSFDGQIVASGGNVLLGTTLVGGVGIFDPHIGDWTYTTSGRVVAGETHSLAAVGQGVSSSMLGASRDRLTALRTQMSTHQYAGLTQDALVGEVMNYTALAYSATVAGNAELQCKACGIVGYALPTIARAHTNAAVTYANGLPQTVSFPGTALSIEMLGRTAVTSDNNAARATTFQRIYGEHASAYAHLLLDAMYTDATHAGSTASSVRALTAANTAGQKIFAVTAANSASILPQLSVDAATQTVVHDAAQAGRTATISQSNVTLGSWNGAGYVLEDPLSGGGDYEVSGRDTAVLNVGAGWLPLALAGTAINVQASAVAAAIQGILDTQIGYYSAAVALLGDYSNVPWANFVGAATVISQWWLCALGSGLPSVLGDPGTPVVIIIGVVTHTTIPGAPQPNNPPYFTSTPVASGSIGQAYQYLATAVDPDGDTLNFSLVHGPAGMHMDGAGLLSWASPTTGSYALSVRVSDGKASVDQSFALTIGQVMPLDMTLAITPQFVNEGDTVTLTVATSGGSGAITKNLTVDGSAVVLDNQGQAKITAHGAGAHAASATASDNQNSITRVSAFGVHVASDTTSPTVKITAPNDGDALTAPAQISGTVADDNVVLWQLLMSPSGLGQWSELARGTQSVNGALATFDPTRMQNGQYDLNLIAYDANGQSASDVIGVLVYGNLKLGQFTVSFNDLRLDVGGLPLTITRTYDSRRKDQQGDFGFGWNLSYQNVSLQRNRPLGEQWEFYQPGFLTFCIRPIGKRVVSIAMADGKVHQFDVTANPQCDTGQVPEVFTVAFTPRPGTSSTLEALDGDSQLFQGGMVVDPDTGGAFDSTHYKLTTLDNYQYVLKSDDNAKTFHMVQITDPNGQTLVITPQGVSSSNGAAIQFVRDAAGRISQVTDLANRSVRYAYTPAGDLDNITSPLNQVSRNQYATVPATLAHLLTSYTDAAGVQQLRNEYDANGNLIAEYDALGNKVDFSAPDLDTHTQRVTDRRGNTTTYVFDDAGNITSITDPLGHVTTASFDSYGNQLSQTDALGHSTSTSYDAQSSTVLSQTDALGNTQTSAWNFYSMMGNHTPQNLQSTTDALGHTTSFGYTSPGMLRAATDPLGHATSFGWGGSNFDQLAQLSDPTGNTTVYQNDAQGHNTQETDPLGNVTKYTYDDAGHPLTTTKTRTIPGGSETVTTRQTLDADGNVLSQTDALGNVTQNTWTTRKLLATQTDPLGHVTQYAYDATGRVIRTTFADGTSEANGYDENGNQVSQTDRAGRIVTTTYDALDRPTVVTNPDSTTLSTTYDAADRVTQTTDELGHATTFQYDATGKKTQSVDAAGNVTGYAYDATGKLTKITDALSNVTQYAYDDASHKTQTTWPDGSTNQYTYDAAGRKTQDIDPLGRAIQFAYDKLGHLNKVTDALGKVTQYGYDELGNKTSQTDALSRLTQWAYDALGRPTSHTLPDNRYETMAYDAAGHQSHRTDFAGNAIVYQYDATDRLTKQTFADGDVIATSYTASGEVASLTQTKNGVPKVTAYSYDTRARLARIDLPDQSRLQYQYDAAGQKTRLTLTTPDHQVQNVDYSYDVAGNLATVVAAGKTFSYKYDAANRKVERDDPNGVVTKYTYDVNGRMTGYVTQQGMGANAVILAQGDYVLNAAGQRTQLAYRAPDGQPRTLAYGYDGAGRLNHESRSLPAHDTTWTLDAIGNRVAQTSDGATSNFALDTTDRLTAITGSNPATYTWDQNGQLATRTQATATTSFSFDARHQLTGATLADGTQLAYDYRADGSLAQKTKTPSGGSAVSTNYLVDPNLPFAQVVAEYDSSGHATSIYVYGDELLMRLKGAQASYYHHDAIGSITLLSDDSGNAIQTYGYDAWGNQVESTGTDDNPYQFAGERIDSDLNLIYLRARWYDPKIGRFVAGDMAAGIDVRPATRNRYVYAEGDPVNKLDPAGLESLIELSVAEDIATDLAISTIKDFAFDAISNAFMNALVGKINFSVSVPNTGNVAGAGIVSVLAIMCEASRSRCFLRGVPTFIAGFETPYSTAHIILGETGNGNTSDDSPKALPFILIKGVGRNDVRPRRGKSGCPGSDPALVCDEYPYASTLEGGNANYRAGLVSLLWVPKSEGPRQGNYLKSFYRKGEIVPVSPAGVFLNVGIPFMPTSFIDRKGNWKVL